MITRNSLLQWHSVAASAWYRALRDDDDVAEDAVAFDRDTAPEWLRGLAITQGWQWVDVTVRPAVPVVRVAARGGVEEADWEAAEIISAFGYSWRPSFCDVFDVATGPLRDLGVRDIVTKILPVPSRVGTAAVRSHGIALTDDLPLRARGRGRAWVQQTSLIADFEQQNAGQLILHNVFVDAELRTRVGRDVAQVSDAVYRGFIASLGGQEGTE